MASATAAINIRVFMTVSCGGGVRKNPENVDGETADATHPLTASASLTRAAFASVCAEGDLLRPPNSTDGRSDGSVASDSLTRARRAPKRGARRKEVG